MISDSDLWVTKVGACGGGGGARLWLLVCRCAGRAAGCAARAPASSMHACPLPSRAPTAPPSPAALTPLGLAVCERAQGDGAPQPGGLCGGHRAGRARGGGLPGQVGARRGVRVGGQALAAPAPQTPPKQRTSLPAPPHASCPAFLFCSASLALNPPRPRTAHEPPRRVTAHYVPVPGQARPKTVLLMKFSGYQAIMQREQRLGGS